MLLTNPGETRKWRVASRLLGRFNRSLQHPKHGGVYGDGKTEIGAVNVAEIILAGATTGMAA
ncbi:hypothetical protein QO005_004777 [Rhizobium paknamense]|uniref:Uncharacterized protein n=1 Tax=Rhizobium paknamense TaxID=1206817 RepID=A0ABU0IJL6_9HYPH|nr:hypothetical protein [Rhizobium paknamense]